MNAMNSLRLWRSLFLRLLSLVLAVIAWGICTTTHAANIGWAQTSGPPGTVLSVAIDPNTPATLYAGTNGGGVFKSTDSGANWSAASTGLSNSNVLSLAIAPSSAPNTPATLYAGTYGGGVFKGKSNSSDATLQSLSLGSGTLSPSFGAATLSYSSSVTIATTTLTPTTTSSVATVTVNGVPVTSGQASAAIALAVGTNTLTVVVTAEDAVTTQTYTVTVTRMAVSTTTTLSFAPAQPVAGNAITLTAQLAPSTAAGTVAFYSDAAATTVVPGCSAQTVTQGQASCTVTPAAAGSFTYVAQYTPADSSMTASTSAAVTVTVTAATPALAITSASLGSLQVGQAVNNVQLIASGGSGSYTWSATSSTQPLPAGLSLSSAGVLSGTPTSTGSYNTLVTVTDSGGTSKQMLMTTKAANTVSQTFTGTVAAAAATRTATPVPSLGAWAVLLLNLMAAALGALGLRWRRRPAQA